MKNIYKIFLLGFLLIGFSVNILSCVKSELSGDDQQAETDRKTARLIKTTTESPKIVSVRINSNESTLISGESGFLEIEIFLKDQAKDTDQLFKWDVGALPPVLWISAPPLCGIHFNEIKEKGRPDQQKRIILKSPEVSTGSIITQVKYFVEPRSKAIHSYFWFDISTSLITADGTRIQDAGEVLVPIRIDTHLKTKLLVLGVIAIVIFLFIVEWVRVDVVAIMIMVALPELGLLDSGETFSGLSSNAVIAIIGVMIISYALNRVGLVNQMIRPVLKLIGKSSSRMLIIFSSLIAVISSVMQNTGAAVLFLPAIRSTASRRVMVPISRVLMPIGMSAILGGTLTMIGTSPLILLNDLLPPGMQKFGFLELSPIGLALVIGGITYFAIFGKYLLNKSDDEQSNSSERTGFFDIKHPLEEYKELDGPFELFIPDSFKAGSKPNKISDIRKQFLVNIVAIATDREIENTAPPPDTTIRPSTGICVFGPKKNVDEFVANYGLKLYKKPKFFKNHFNSMVANVIEVVISPRSTLIGQTIKEIGFRNTFRVNALALYQDGEVYYQELAAKQLKAGDAILLHGTWKQFQSLKELHQNFIITTATKIEAQKQHKSKHALICFIATLVLMLFSSFYFQNKSYNPIPLSICLMIGALGMILSGILSISEAYRSVDWRTVFLLGGLLPLGMSVAQTGTAEWVAKGIVSGMGGDAHPIILLGVLACLSAAFTLVISNIGACTLLIPLGISLANQMGLDPRVAAIVIGIGVSNSFILPTHQVNALYMGPGGYKTLDYIKVGLPMSILYIGILVSMTYFFYT